MLPTFVIGLREGLEAALIVGIIAAFLRKQGRRDLLGWVFAGIGAAIALCVAVGVTLEAISRELPQRQQEGLETVIGLFAVAMVTYMVVWMKHHSRELKSQLEGLASNALTGSSRAGRAMVAMAFLAVLREGFETVVFLTAAFNEATSGVSAAIGAVLGIVVAVGLGYGIYRGGVRINLSRFFRATGLVLVLVAAGLVVNAVHTAHEAGWLTVGQAGTVDLSVLVRLGSVQASLLTGMLGIQPHPVVAEVLAWFAYLIPVGCYVVWPPSHRLRPITLARVLAGLGALGGAAALALALLAPTAPSTGPATATTRFRPTDAHTGVVHTAQRAPAAGQATGSFVDVAVHKTGAHVHGGMPVDVYDGSPEQSPAATESLPRHVSYQRVAELNGGRLPIGVRAVDGGSATLRYTDTEQLTAWVEPRTGRVLDLRWHEAITAAVIAPTGAAQLTEPVRAGTYRLPAATVASARAAADADLARLDHRATMIGVAWVAGVTAVLLWLAAAGVLARERTRSLRAARPTLAEEASPIH